MGLFKRKWADTAINLDDNSVDEEVILFDEIKSTRTHPEVVEPNDSNSDTGWGNEAPAANWKTDSTDSSSDWHLEVKENISDWGTPTPAPDNGFSSPNSKNQASWSDTSDGTDTSSRPENKSEYEGINSKSERSNSRPENKSEYEGINSESVWGTESPNGDIDKVNEDFGDMVVHQQEVTEEKVITEVVSDDYGDVVLSEAEKSYETEEMKQKVKPFLDETVKKNQDKLKLEIHEVLDDEVGYRLSRYEKRRRRRDMKERLSSIIKGVAAFVVIVIILGNSQLRTRFAIVFKDFGDLFSDVLSGKDTSSNKLVKDLLGDMANDINEENIVETNGFNIEGGNADNEVVKGN